MENSTLALVLKEGNIGRRSLRPEPSWAEPTAALATMPFSHHQLAHLLLLIVAWLGLHSFELGLQYPPMGMCFHLLGTKLIMRIFVGWYQSLRNWTRF